MQDKIKLGKHLPSSYAFATETKSGMVFHAS